MSKVAISRCPDYNESNLIDALKNIFDKLGGIDKYISPGTKVALKPNLVMKKHPSDAATTHPSLIYALCTLIHDAGGIVTIMDSPGGLYNKKILKGVYSACGIKKAAEDTNANLNYDVSEVEVDSPLGKYLKKVTVIKPLIDADIIINLPKLKTHGQMVYTGAVKNMFGAVPGVLKAEYHFRMPEYNEFANAIIDIFLSVKPTLNIMDAVVGMEGYGPTAGNPREIGLILASEDAFRLDFTALNIVGANAMDVPVIKEAAMRGLCPERMEDIELLFDDINKVKIKDFDIPQIKMLRTIQFYDKGILKYFIKFVKPKPVFIHKMCVGCEICANSCPAHIITMHEKRPQVDLPKCIRCFCCQELCPAKAIVIKRPALIDFFIRHKRR